VLKHGAVLGLEAQPASIIWPESAPNIMLHFSHFLQIATRKAVVPYPFEPP
jgi:hypothetical protein